MTVIEVIILAIAVVIVTVVIIGFKIIIRLFIVLQWCVTNDRESDARRRSGDEEFDGLFIA